MMNKQNDPIKKWEKIKLGFESLRYTLNLPGLARPIEREREREILFVSVETKETRGEDYKNDRPFGFSLRFFCFIPKSKQNGC